MFFIVSKAAKLILFFFSYGKKREKECRKHTAERQLTEGKKENNDTHM